MATTPDQTQLQTRQPAGTSAALTPAPKRQLSSLDVMKQTFATQKFKDELAMALPKHLTPDRQLRVILTTLNKNPKIADCTQASVITCLMDCSAMGLEPDGRRAHLIPYGQQCTLIIDYKGIIELIMRSGEVDFIDAYCVYQKDEFKLIYGANPDITHIPSMEEDPGPMIGAYAVAHIKDVKKPKFTFLRMSDIKKIRDSSKAKNSGPWVQWFDEMAKKSAIRRLSKTLPLSSDFHELLEKEITHEHGGPIDDARFRAATPIAATVTNTERRQLRTATPTAEETRLAAAAAAINNERETGGGEQQQQVEGDTAGEQQRQETEDERAEREAGLAPDPQPAKPVEKAPELKVVQSPPAPAKNAAPAKTPSNNDAHLGELQALVAAEGFQEEIVCQWAVKTFNVSPADTLSALHECAPRKITQILQGWSMFKSQIKDFHPE